MLEDEELGGDAYGFVDLYTQRKGIVEGWLEDPRDSMRAFAADFKAAAIKAAVSA